MTVPTDLVAIPVLVMCAGGAGFVVSRLHSTHTSGRHPGFNPAAGHQGKAKPALERPGRPRRPEPPRRQERPRRQARTRRGRGTTVMITALAVLVLTYGYLHLSFLVAAVAAAVAALVTLRQTRRRVRPA
jgi:hypothetical protein